MIDKYKVSFIFFLVLTRADLLFDLLVDYVVLNIRVTSVDCRPARHFMLL